MIETIATIVLLVGTGIVITVGALVCLFYVSLQDD